MGTICLFSDNASTNLAAPLSIGATTCTLNAGTGSEFPNPQPGQFFTLTFNDVLTGLAYEICYCTARTGDVLTITRAQEGTADQSWLAGDIAFNGPTAGTMRLFRQEAGSHYNTDVGTVNNIVIATNPTITAYTKGFEIQFEVANTNTSSLGMTVNAGGGPVPLFRNDGHTPIAGDLQAGVIYSAIAILDGGPFWVTEYLASQLKLFAALSPWIYINYTTQISPGDYLPDTRSGSITLTLAPNPAPGDNYGFNDQLNCFGANPLIINTNGVPIDGVIDTWSCNIPGAIFTLVYDPVSSSFVVNYNA